MILPILQKPTEYIIPYYISRPPLIQPQLIRSPDSFLTSIHATPAQGLQLHVKPGACHSLAMHFATFAGSDYKALEPIVELEQARPTMEMATGAADRLGSEDDAGKGWLLWVISGWKMGWASSMSARPLWCMLTRHFRAQNSIAP